DDHLPRVAPAPPRRGRAPLQAFTARDPALRRADPGRRDHPGARPRALAGAGAFLLRSALLTRHRPPPSRLSSLGSLPARRPRGSHRVLAATIAQAAIEL